MTPITIGNDGQNLVSTNYWDSEYASNGLVFLTYNAGAARLLVPPAHEADITDMRTASHVIVTRGFLLPERRDSLEIMFEDGSDSPFVMTISVGQSDRALPEAERGKRFPFRVYTRSGLVWETEGRYRRTPRLPCLAAWR